MNAFKSVIDDKPVLSILFYQTLPMPIIDTYLTRRFLFLFSISIEGVDIESFQQDSSEQVQYLKIKNNDWVTLSLFYENW